MVFPQTEVAWLDRVALLPLDGEVALVTWGSAPMVQHGVGSSAGP